MTIYQTCINEAKYYTDRDAYVSDLALSSIWGDEEGAEVPQERLEWLGQLWDACNRSVKEIAKAAGLSQRKLAERFAVPYRTAEDWCSRGSCPIYVRLMMQEALGLLRHDV
jgi:hypothetical protein